jgi:two-component system, NarL family, sensor histidine kinase LiaS
MLMSGFFRSLTARLFLSHILVAALTSIIVTSGMLLVIWASSRSLTVDDYRGAALQYAAMWLFDFPESEFPIPPDDLLAMPGFTLIVNPQDEVLWVRGETTCQKGMIVSDCEPLFANAQPLGRMIQKDGQPWGEVVMRLAGGERVMLRRGPTSAEPYLYIGDLLIYGYRDMLLFEVLTHGGLGIPVALLLAALIARPQIRRLSAITQTSRKFAAGNLDTRVSDRHRDEVGQLAQQFDDMADALQQNIGALRDLAQRNGELAQQAEGLAIQAERTRISRDLHDAIAQRLFSLSMSTAALPELIAQDRDRGVEQAKAIARLAEQTQLDLRGLLLELRPTTVLQHGLSSAMRALCEEWGHVNHIPADCDVILTGRHIPAVIEDALYRIAQEALSNIARHAHATRVHVSLVEGQRQIILSVTDNGVGFRSDAPHTSGRFGLTSMRERARSVGGELIVESTPAAGTTIQATLPIHITEQTAHGG